MPKFPMTIAADTLPQIEGEQLRATIENKTQGTVDFYTGPADAGSFDIEYVGNYGDELSVTRAWVLGDRVGPATGAALVQLPFPVLPVPTGGGVSVRLA